MIEARQKKGFLSEFLEEVETKAIKMGSYELPLLEKMIEYMDRQDDPESFIPAYIDSSKKIKVNAYSYDDDQKSLDLYVVNYDFDQDEDTLKSITMTSILEFANMAKRFVTNAKSIVETIDRSMPVRELGKIILSEQHVVDDINIFVLTNLYYESNKPIDLSIPGYESVNVQVWDIDRIQQLVTSEQGIQSIYIDFEEELGETFEMMFVPDPKQDAVKDNFDCYIGFIPAEFLAKAYDQWGPKLVERNVRSFLQARGGTNKGIRDTLKDPDQRQMFVAYNNGISSVARSAEITKIKDNVNLYQIKGLTGWQIVNGGQTTASIHQAYKNGIDLSDVYIQAKLTILQVEADKEKDRHLLEDEMVAKISEYANTQNKINKSDLLSNTRFMSEIEKYSRDIWIPTKDGRKSESKWYFERARGQYMVDISRRKRGREQSEFKKQYPKEFVLTKVDLAKYFMSWEGYPHISSKGGEMAFKRFMEANRQYWKHERDENNNIITLEEMTSESYKKLIAKSIINLRVKSIVEEMNIRGYRANVVYYTVSILNHLYGEKIDLLTVWENQTLTDKWDEPICIIAENTLNYLRESAGDRNVTQWAKQEACWVQFKEQNSKQLSNIL
ncbi:AIPR family protein [Alkalihalobacillus sp. R86527]|uniref:AIPR family protein n=1 Tax=Alkalihalobacillus sp. R86527 TaxID=3093863 RepID=UPI00366CFA71